MERPRFCLINDDLIDETVATVSVADRGFLYADGVFETLRAYGGKPFRLPDHWSRLRRSAAFLGIPAPNREPDQALQRTLEANGLRDGSLRITLSRGPEPRGPRPGAGPGLGRPTLVIQAHPLRPDLDRRAQRGTAGQRLPWPLRAGGLGLQQHKTLAYLSSVVALNAVPGATEPILENTNGDVAEGATSNIFWVQGGTLFTPHPEAGCLPGITRGLVLELARRHGYPAIEGRFPWHRLAAAEEVFLTNSVIEIAPLVRLDGQPLGTGVPGPVTRALQGAYRDLVAAETGAR